MEPSENDADKAIDPGVEEAVPSSLGTDPEIASSDEPVPEGDDSPADEVAPPVPDEPADAVPTAEVNEGVEVASEMEGGMATDPLLVGGSLALLIVLFLAVMAGRRRTTQAPSIGDPRDRTSSDPPEPSIEEPPAIGLTARLRDRMAKTRAALAGSLDDLFGRVESHGELFEELEDILLVADVGIATSQQIVARLREHVASGQTDLIQLRERLREMVRSLLTDVAGSLGAPPESGPWVLLVVGVNGSGKTTTIGKLAARFRREGQKVLLAAGDTYRAAAAEQLEIWADRAEVDIVRHDEGADPGAVVYEALEVAHARAYDVVIIDTAGRLQTRRPLMEQLGKVRRVIGKKVPDGPHETLLVIDGTMGQNAMSQARSFHEATPLTGVVVTKLDGTAKGGMVLSIASEMQLPVKLIGIGEQIDDLRDFEPEAFVDALI